MPINVPPFDPFCSTHVRHWLFWLDLPLSCRLESLTYFKYWPQDRKQPGYSILVLNHPPMHGMFPGAVMHYPRTSFIAVSAIIYQAAGLVESMLWIWLYLFIHPPFNPNFQVNDCWSSPGAHFKCQTTLIFEAILCGYNPHPCRRLSLVKAHRLPFLQMTIYQASEWVWLTSLCYQALTYKVVVNYVGTAGFATMLVIIYYFMAYNPTNDPFRLNCQAGQPLSRPNPVDMFILRSLRGALNHIPLPKRIRFSASKKTELFFLKVDSFQISVPCAFK